MTVDARLQLTPGEYLIHPDGSASKVVDKRNLTVDEILATGQYTDRRGRAWNYDPDFDVWVEYSSRDDGILHLGWIVDTKDVRLLIERDLHRDECEGLQECRDHPVPFVEIFRHPIPPYHVDYQVVDTSVEPSLNQGIYRAHADAMSAARALAVGE